MFRGFFFFEAGEAVFFAIGGDAEFEVGVVVFGDAAGVAFVKGIGFGFGSGLESSAAFRGGGAVLGVLEKDGAGEDGEGDKGEGVGDGVVDWVAQDDESHHCDIEQGDVFDLDREHEHELDDLIGVDHRESEEGGVEDDVAYREEADAEEEIGDEAADDRTNHRAEGVGIEPEGAPGVFESVIDKPHEEDGDEDPDEAESAGNEDEGEESPDFAVEDFGDTQADGFEEGTALALEVGENEDEQLKAGEDAKDAGDGEALVFLLGFVEAVHFRGNVSRVGFRVRDRGLVTAETRVKTRILTFGTRARVWRGL